MNKKELKRLHKTIHEYADMRNEEENVNDKAYLSGKVVAYTEIYNQAIFDTGGNDFVKLENILKN